MGEMASKQAKQGLARVYLSLPDVFSPFSSRVFIGEEEEER